MTKLLSLAALLTGAAAIAWMGLAFIGIDGSALLVTLVIGAVYLVGFTELLRYQQATTALTNALQAVTGKVSSLDDWLLRLPSSLQIGVRLRIQGEHVGLPAPVLAPYLIGLLVMLGLLGTFIGMVDTLQGAVVALQGTTELQAIRAGLAAPINGLGVAFGTSVAGVAASAMLGFVATLSRRDRLLASRLLDSKVGNVFQEYSLPYNRQQTYLALQQQAQALPVVAEKLTALADSLQQIGEQLGTSLTNNQQQFHTATQAVYTDLAHSIDRSLQQNLADSGRLAGASIEPVIRQMMRDISGELKTSQQQLNSNAQQQLETLSHHFVNTSEQVSQAWQLGLSAHQTANSELLANVGDSLLDFKQQFDDSSQAAASQMVDRVTGLLQTTEQLVARRIDSESQWLDSYNQRMEQMTATLKTELLALRDAEQQRGESAVDRLSELQIVVAEHLTTLGNKLEQPMSQLIQSATETPRAAAALFEKMRAEISLQIERDNAMLEDRQAIMAQLNTLSGSLEQATHGQREAIDSMVLASSELLAQVGSRFAEQLDSEALKLSTVADHFAGSATEMSSLGEAFGLAVQLFNNANNSLIDSLTRIEQALQNSTERSDEQLAYYIAQAREIIDHSVLSQQEVIDQLQLFSPADHSLAAEAC